MNKIRTILPLSLEDMRTVITQPDTIVEIDYAHNKLKGTAALIYLTNTNLPNIVLDVNGSTVQDILTLVDNYITHKSTIFIPQLIDSVMHLLLVEKGLPVPGDIENATLLSSVIVNEFTKDEVRKGHLSNLIHVMDNLLLFAITCSQGFKELYGKPQNIFPEINDINYTGFTFVNLFQHPLILDYYTAPMLTKPAYFTQQFDEYVYNGKSLFVFLSTSPILAVMDTIITGKITAEQILDARKQLIELEGATA